VETVAGPRQIEPGTKLDDKYRIEQLLAVGGMGAVYLGTHVPLRKRVAIKVLNPQVSTTAMIERFHREAIIVSQIGHEGIAQVTDFGTSVQGEPFLVMEYLEGESLAARLTTAGQLPIEVACELGSAILAPLSAAHEAGVVHRDLKPDNVFLVRQSRGEAVKLLDFGISRAPGLEGEFRLTKTGLVLGTPYYMSPEQARGESEVGPAADIYAFGVILYEMLIGRVPIDGENYNQLMFHVLTGEFPSPRSERPEIPEELERIILQAMALDPARRPATAVELEQRLLAFCRPTFRDHQIERISSASSSGFSYLTPASGAQIHLALPTDPDLPRNVRGDAVAVPASETGILQLPDEPPEPSAPVAAAPLPRRRGLWIVGAAVVVCGVIAGALAVAGRRGDDDRAPPPETTPIRAGETPQEKPPTPPETPPETPATKPPTAVDRTAPDPREAAAPAPEAITLRFAIEPASATIWLDGVAVKERQLTVRKDGALHKLRISAPGYTAHEDQVRFDETQKLTVQLKRRTARPQRGKPNRIESESPYE
jgi:serine/threonine-protein kinase